MDGLSVPGTVLWIKKNFKMLAEFEKICDSASRKGKSPISSSSCRKIWSTIIYWTQKHPWRHSILPAFGHYCYVSQSSRVRSMCFFSRRPLPCIQSATSICRHALSLSFWRYLSASSVEPPFKPSVISTYIEPNFYFIKSWNS